MNRETIPMNNQVTVPSSLLLHARFILGVTIAFGATLLVGNALLNPDAEQFRTMAFFLGMTAAASVALAYVLHRTGLFRYAPRLSFALMAGYILSSLLTFFNVWVTARLMLSDHDLQTTTVLLVFASGVAISFGYFISESMTGEVSRLNRAAQEIARGKLEVRVPVKGRDEVAALANTFNDMAEQLEQADASRRETEQLRRSFVAWVGHDLRTPLASLRAMLDALQDDLVEDKATEERYLRNAQGQVETLSLLVDDLFDMAQLDTLGMPLVRQPVDLGDLISDTIESFTAIAKQSQISLSGKVDPDIPPLSVDGGRIERVLSNLVSNALRYTPAGGNVCIEALSTADPEAVAVMVSDNGQGIPKDDLPYIFDQFYRGEKSRSRSTGGSGLGLAIAQRIVEAHGGEIYASSEEGHGTTIRFELPLQ